LDEWLEETISKYAQEPNDTFARIKQAEFASFKLQTKLEGDYSAGVAPFENSRSHRTRARQLQAQTMEKDFTTARSAGQLGCPFAPVGGSRTSLHLDQQSKPSKRLSFNDPIRPIVGFSPAISLVEVPACPIRYLDQHSPEDIAEYFEQHKHELPRSHEVCVKRFQDNADSIRELDAKYGNLVSMIQGLGQKHQPMLPDTPPQDNGAAEEDEEQLSNQKIKQWAKSVSEDHPEDGGNEHTSRTNSNPASSILEDERIPHFDRPLKEIRVGESPSRPWGVPIPSKYLERKARSGPVSSADPAPRTKQCTKHATIANLQDQLDGVPLPQHLAAAQVHRRALICQHNGQDMRKDAAEPSARSIMQAAQTSSSNMEGELQCAGNRPFDQISTNANPPASPRSADPASRESHTLAIPPSIQQHGPNGVSIGPSGLQAKRRDIFNYGVAVIAQSKHLEHHTLTNHGTLIIGYGEASASKLLKEVLGRSVGG